MPNLRDFIPVNKGPLDGPLLTVQYCQDYASYVAGAVLDALRKDATWLGEGASDEDMLEKIDQLAELLITPVVLGGTDVLHISPLSWRPTVGAWTKDVDIANGLEPQITSVATSPIPRAVFPVSLRSGDWKIVTHHAVFTSGGAMVVSFKDATGTVAQVSIYNYSPSGSVAVVTAHTINLTDDFEGEIEIWPVGNPPPDFAGGTIGHIYSMTVYPAS